MQIDRETLEQVEAALDDTRHLVAEAAGTGFNWQDGDWAERLYANNGTISAALARLRKAMEAGTDEAKAFDNADWYWRVMDPDDSGCSPEEAISRSMLGPFCVCEIASNYSGPTRYGFVAPTQDDDTEFVHFATHEEAVAAVKDRVRKAMEDGKDG